MYLDIFVYNIRAYILYISIHVEFRYNARRSKILSAICNKTNFNLEGLLEWLEV